MLQILTGGRYGWSLGAGSWGWRLAGRNGSSGIIEDPDGHGKSFDFILSVVGSW